MGCTYQNPRELLKNCSIITVSILQTNLHFGLENKEPNIAKKYHKSAIVTDAWMYKRLTHSCTTDTQRAQTTAQ